MSIAPALLYAGTLATMRRLQRERDFDLIDAHYFYPDGVAAVTIGRALNKPVVITARGTDINLIPQYPVPRRMILDAARDCAAIITVCNALRDELVTLGADVKKITPLRNGVDLLVATPGRLLDLMPASIASTTARRLGLPAAATPRARN